MKKRLTISLSEEQYERLQDVANELGGSLSQAMSWVMMQWDAQLSSSVSDSYSKYGELRGALEHLKRRYDAAAEIAEKNESECREHGLKWSEGQYNGQSYAYSMASTDLLLLLTKLM